MHTLTGNRDQVLQLMNNTIMKMQTTPQASAASIGGSEGADETTVLTTLNAGFLAEQGRAGGASAASINFADQQNEDWYVPREQAVAVFQSVMDEYLEDQDAPEAPPKAGSAGAASIGEGQLSHSEIAASVFYGGAEPGTGAGAVAEALMEQFDNLDPKWVEVVWEKTKLLLKGKHHFTTHEEAPNINFDMDDETTIAVVGDWGGGNDAAQAIAEQIKAIKPNHIIHLGDVYYAGTPKEINERFLTFWPTPAEPGKSFALNSNHEMYSGGYGYFDVTLPKFKQPASYFSLSNQNWRLIGLDSGYDEHDLHPPQADWLKTQLVDDGRKNILFSHHQLFSAYETATDCSKLQAKVQPFLDAGKIYGWIWGHEHLCVAYKQFMGIKGVCLGNGCFPYNPPQGKPDNVEWMNNRAQPNDPDYRGIHTFAMLKVTPAQIEIQYIDQDGIVGYKQTWN
jgi:hypothetical protein